MPSRLQPCYTSELGKAISRFLPQKGLALLSDDKRVRWNPRMLVVCATLMAWQSALTLKDRFAAAAKTVTQMYPTRRRPGKSYQGFIRALAGSSATLLESVCVALRQAVVKVAGDTWEVCGWVVFGCDGTKIDCPMTQANEEALGCCGKKKSTPQQLLTTLFHVGSGLPWSFVRGAGRASERSHLLAMLGLLPERAMLLADAGFTGYELLKAIMETGRCFVIRVGANVRLLTKLGYALEEHEGIVYLWPDDKKKDQCPPLVLRLIRFTDARNRTICLLSNVLDPQVLSDQTALRMYRLRWGVELIYRAMKQTLGRRKMLSDSPAHAAVELDWSFVGLWLLGLLSVQEITAAGGRIEQWSVAASLRVVREAADARRWRGPRLSEQLATCVKDNYQRTSSKKARHWPHKKKDKPPGQPKARTATAEEVLLAAEIRTKKIAA